MHSFIWREIELDNLCRYICAEYENKFIGVKFVIPRKYEALKEIQKTINNPFK